VELAQECTQQRSKFLAVLEALGPAAFVSVLLAPCIHCS